MICLENSPRSRKELQDIFWGEINEIIAARNMGQFDSSNLVFVVEGKLDNEIFAKLRHNNYYDIVSIENVISGIVNVRDRKIESKERDRLPSAKSAVEIVTQRFSQNSIPVLGIQDEDFESIIASFNGGGHSKANKNNILSTFPSTDIETMFYSMLVKKSGIWFFHHQSKRRKKLDVEKDRKNCKNLAIARIASLLYQRLHKNKISKVNNDGKNIHSISKLEPVWDKEDREGSLEKQNYYRIFTAEIESLLEKILEQGRFTDSSLFLLYVEMCKQVKEHLLEKKYPWDYYIRGHDLEWFIRFNNGIGTMPLRKQIKKKFIYDLLKDHDLFKNIEAWRIGNGHPQLFKSS